METQLNIYETAVRFYGLAKEAAEDALLSAGIDGVAFSEVFYLCQAAAREEFPEIEYGPEEFATTLSEVQQKHLGLAEISGRLHILV